MRQDIVIVVGHVVHVVHVAGIDHTSLSFSLASIFSSAQLIIAKFSDRGQHIMNWALT